MENKKSKKVDLRKKTGQHFLMGLSVALSFTLLAFEWRTFEDKNSIADNSTPIDLIDDDPIPVTIRKIPKPETPKPKFDMKLAPIVAKPIELIITKDPEPIQTLIDLPTSEIGELDPDPFFEPEVLEVEPFYKNPEKMPEYFGGERELFKYLGQSIKYPRRAIDSGIDGVVYVQFIVNKDGSISDAKVVRGIGGGCDEEALRVVNEMNNWIPGKQGGNKVRVLFNLPIKFKLKR